MRAALASPNSLCVKRVVFLFGSSCLSARALYSLVMRSSSGQLHSNLERQCDRAERSLVRTLVSSPEFQKGQMQTPLRDTKLFVLVLMQPPSMAPVQDHPPALHTEFVPKPGLTVKCKRSEPIRITLNATDADTEAAEDRSCWFLCKHVVKGLRVAQ
jgi:hypothetical protein